MAAAANPFSTLSLNRQQQEPPEPQFQTGDDQMDPAYRIPAFQAPEEDEGYEAQEPLDDDAKAVPMDDGEILQLLAGYFDEAENARETGFEPRHDVWEQNLHAFWMRRNFPDKQPWQSKEKSAYVPTFVERFAAGQREALTADPNWMEIEDRYDETGTLSKFATKLTRIALDYAGTNASGHPVAFEHDFGNHVLTGCLMKMCAAVTWDPRNGRVLIEQRDPRQTYLDPTGRGLYRVSFWEADKETLLRMAELKNAKNEPLYDKESIEGLCAQKSLDVSQNQEDSSGAGSMSTSARTPILIKEWLVDLIDRGNGEYGKEIVRERQLVVVANDSVIIRGPEKNPYWHGKDWVVSHAVLQAPMKAIDGRTYVETFLPAVNTHENITNRILDAFTMSSLNAFEVNPDVLDDPTQLEFGISPNMTVMRDPDAPAGDRAITAIELGRQTSADASNLWAASRREAQEAGSQSDLSLGQTARGETTATEAQLSNAGQNALQNSISIDIDVAYLAVLAELTYYCALQHVGPSSKGIWWALSPDEQAMLKSRRQEFRDQPIQVRAKGLTNAVKRKQRLRGLTGALNVIGGNPILLQQFMKDYSVSKLVMQILNDFGVETEKIELSEDEKFMRDDALRQAKAKQDAATALGGAPGAEAGGPPQATASAQGGLDPLAAGAAGGLPGDVQ